MDSVLNNFIKNLFFYLFFVIQLINLPCNVSSLSPQIKKLNRRSSSKEELETGTYAHYSFEDRGNFRIVLTSLEGDADLYASDKHKIVDSSNYEWQSLTYGEDEIFISENMQRPVAISVFAHPYYIKSVYEIKVFQIQMSDTSYETINTNSFENLNLFFSEDKTSHTQFADPKKEYNINEQHEMNSNNQENIDKDDIKESWIIKMLISLFEIVQLFI